MFNGTRSSRLKTEIPPPPPPPPPLAPAPASAPVPPPRPPLRSHHQKDPIVDNLYGHTALHVASVRGDVEEIRRLLDRGFCTQTEDKGGKTPSELASIHHGIDLVTGVQNETLRSENGRLKRKLEDLEMGNTLLRSKNKELTTVNGDLTNRVEHLKRSIDELNTSMDALTEASFKKKPKK